MTHIVVYRPPISEAKPMTMEELLVILHEHITNNPQVASIPVDVCCFDLERRIRWTELLLKSDGTALFRLMVEE